MKKSIFNSIIALVIVGVLQACTSSDATVGTPSVTSVSPASGPVGTYVKISGTFFSTTKPNVVKFNGVEATVLSSTTSAITALVPSGATTGKVTVGVESITGSSTSDYSVVAGTAAPVILGLSTASGNGADGTEVTITGYNFSSTAANNVVKFNGVTAAVSKASATSLTVNVPAGSTTGKITVNVSGATQQATSDSDFAVPAPTVDSFTPAFSVVGATVVITGTNFSKTASNNVVKFNGVTAATPLVGSTSSLTVTVPVGATTGKITVTVDGKTGTGGEFNLPHKISDFTPLLGKASTSSTVNGTTTITPGAEVTINGTNFSSSDTKNVVKFGNKEAKTVTAVSGTVLKAIVPEGAASGKISVTINGQTVTSVLDFIVN